MNSFPFFSETKVFKINSCPFSQKKYLPVTGGDMIEDMSHNSCAITHSKRHLTLLAFSPRLPRRKLWSWVIWIVVQTSFSCSGETAFHLFPFFLFSGVQKQDSSFFFRFGAFRFVSKMTSLRFITSIQARSIPCIDDGLLVYFTLSLENDESLTLIQLHYNSDPL